MFENKKTLVKKIASERIEILFGLADSTIKNDPELSGRYVRSLRKIISHYKVKAPKKINNSICTRCNILLSPGLTSTVRVVSSKRYIAYKCNKCGKEIHVRY
ncbi:MAG: ribonuclease P protein component 4 [Candidatus Micrarchaeales archaeon]